MTKCEFNPARCKELVEADRAGRIVEGRGFVTRWSKNRDSSGVFYLWEFHFPLGIVECYWSIT